jgi:hypothetical protein
MLAHIGSTGCAYFLTVLDGDIDAEWIESMNTVMDDNKMLTLASNERIPLTPSMRLLLEINHMNHCSPATVSRGGVIYVNAEDVGWKPVVDSWIERLEASEYRSACGFNRSPLLVVLLLVHSANSQLSVLSSKQVPSPIVEFADTMLGVSADRLSTAQ